MSISIRGRHLSMLGLLTAIFAAGCASFTTYGDGTAVRTKYAQSLWERPPTPKECETPVVTTAARKRLGLRQSQTIVDFVIPPPRR
jgi:hypothetical protein